MDLDHAWVGVLDPEHHTAFVQAVISAPVGLCSDC
jgi:hypothetical protein